MAPMRVRTALATVAALAIGACGQDKPPLSADCTQGAAPLSAALAAAPGQVRLADGTRLSDCVSRAASDAEIQEVAAGATVLADLLAAKAARDEASAVRLGYLVGAARRGGRHTAGIHAELVRRLESAAAAIPASRRAAYESGLAAGARDG
jgi:hypothetical protein